MHSCNPRPSETLESSILRSTLSVQGDTWSEACFAEAPAEKARYLSHRAERRLVALLHGRAAWTAGIEPGSGAAWACFGPFLQSGLRRRSDFTLATGP